MRRRGLRARVTAMFALGAAALSLALSSVAYEVTRSNLLAERERTLVAAAYRSAGVVQTGLQAGAAPADLLARLDTGAGRRPLLRRDGSWVAEPADRPLTDDVPDALLRQVATGQPAAMRAEARGAPALMVGVPLAGPATAYVEVASLAELRRTLSLLGTVLGLAAVGTTLAGAALGTYASRRALDPLRTVAGAADQIATGDRTARVARDTDPDLDRLAVAFNRMVDAVQAKAEADRRFAADVSHELRSPLQTLTAAASVLTGARGALDPRTASAVDLLDGELARFSQLVTDLLELARSDRPAERRPTDVGALVRSVCADRGVDADAVRLDGVGTPLDVDPRRLRQVLANLLDNAARHGGGAVRVAASGADGWLRLEVDDAGPGVPPEERELVFDRFARGRTASSRRTGDGTGLGLALVAQHVAAHGGRVRVEDRPGGGARFVVDLPADGRAGTAGDAAAGRAAGDAPAGGAA